MITLLYPLLVLVRFLSIQAQDFIEEHREHHGRFRQRAFLSIQAQDFIEDWAAASSRRQASRNS